MTQRRTIRLVAAGGVLAATVGGCGKPNGPASQPSENNPAPLNTWTPAAVLPTLPATSPPPVGVNYCYYGCGDSERYTDPTPPVDPDPQGGGNQPGDSDGNGNVVGGN